jgi:hypothetical protein
MTTGLKTRATRKTKAAVSTLNNPESVPSHLFAPYEVPIENRSPVEEHDKETLFPQLSRKGEYWEV